MLDVVDTSFDFFYIGIHMYYAGYRISFGYHGVTKRLIQVYRRVFWIALLRKRGRFLFSFSGTCYVLGFIGYRGIYRAHTLS